MTSIVFGGRPCKPLFRSITIPSYSTAVPGRAYAIQRLPSEPIGFFLLTLTNLIAGSAVRVESPISGDLVGFIASSGTSEGFSVPAYPFGSSSNILRIKVRKGSVSPFYIPWETQATSFVGSQSIYVSQISDE